MAKKETEENGFPAYALVLEKESKQYLHTFIKMYQLYYFIDRAYTFENTQYKNHFVRLSIEGEQTVYSWLEFMMYEIVDLINNLHTISDGVYTTCITTADFLKTLNFELFWEQLEDWAEYLDLDDFEDDNNPNIEYIYKMFKCTEHYLNVHKSLPETHKDAIEDVMVDIDEYYATYIQTEAVTADEEDDKGNAEINAGVIPNTTSPAIAQNTIPEENDDDDDDDDEDERSIKADIIGIELKTHGIYTAQ